MTLRSQICRQPRDVRHFPSDGRGRNTAAAVGDRCACRALPNWRNRSTHQPDHLLRSDIRIEAEPHVAVPDIAYASSRNAPLARFLARHGLAVVEMAMPYHKERSRPGSSHADDMLSPNGL